MQMFLKDDTQHTWSVYQINNIPTAISGWNIVVMLLTSAYIDATGHRMGVIVGLLVSPYPLSHFSPLFPPFLTYPHPHLHLPTVLPPLRNHNPRNLVRPARPQNHLLPFRRPRRSSLAHRHVMGEPHVRERPAGEGVDARVYEFTWGGDDDVDSAIFVPCDDGTGV